MRQLSTSPQYITASEHLAALHDAEAAALADEAAALARLSEPLAPPESSLARAAALLRGEPATGVDTVALTARLADARQRIRLLRSAIGEQEAIVARIRGEVSRAINDAAQEGHQKAVKAIAAGLESLRAALDAEAALRDGIAVAGYWCNLEPMTRPQLRDEIEALLTDCRRYLAGATLRSGGGANVLVLRDVAGVGRAGDVLRLDGPAAAALVASGAGEVTTDKPRRSAPHAAAGELVLS